MFLLAASAAALAPVAQAQIREGSKRVGAPLDGLTNARTGRPYLSESNQLNLVYFGAPYDLNLGCNVSLELINGAAGLLSGRNINARAIFICPQPEAGDDRAILDRALALPNMDTLIGPQEEIIAFAQDKFRMRYETGSDGKLSHHLTHTYLTTTDGTNLAIYMNTNEPDWSMAHDAEQRFRQHIAFKSYAKPDTHFG